MYSIIEEMRYNLRNKLVPEEDIEGTKQIINIAERHLKPIRISGISPEMNPYLGRMSFDLGPVKHRCYCACHDPGVWMVHFAPCCYDGYTETDRAELIISSKEFEELGFKEDSEYKGVWSRPYNDPFPFELYIRDGFLIGQINREYRVIDIKNEIWATKANVERLLEIFCPQFKMKS